VAVRPSWVDVKVDGRKTEVGTGPRAGDGDMRAVFYLRSDGDIDKVLTVECRSDGETVTLLVWAGNGGLVHKEERQY
jgi:hypothetical protein